MQALESSLWGIIAALSAFVVGQAAVLVHRIFSDTSTMQEMSVLATSYLFIILLAAIEEALKYTVIASRIDSISLGRNYITNSFCLGLGFGLAEAAMALADAGTPSSLSAILQVLLLHAGTAALIGYVIALGNPRKISTIVSALAASAFAHAAYNMLVIQKNAYADSLSSVIVVFLIAYAIVNILRLPGKLATS